MSGLAALLIGAAPILVHFFFSAGQNLRLDVGDHPPWREKGAPPAAPSRTEPPRGRTAPLGAGQARRPVARRGARTRRAAGRRHRGRREVGPARVASRVPSTRSGARSVGAPFSGVTGLFSKTLGAIVGLPGQMAVAIAQALFDRAASSAGSGAVYLLGGLGSEMSASTRPRSAPRTSRTSSG